MKKGLKLLALTVILCSTNCGHGSQFLLFLGCCNTVASVAGAVASTTSTVQEVLKDRCRDTGVWVAALNEKLLESFEKTQQAFRESCQRTREKWLRWKREQRTQWMNFSSQFNLCPKSRKGPGEDLISSIQRKSSRQNSSFQRRYS